MECGNVETSKWFGGLSEDSLGLFFYVVLAISYMGRRASNLEVVQRLRHHSRWKRQQGADDVALTSWRDHRDGTPSSCCYQRRAPHIYLHRTLTSIV